MSDKIYNVLFICTGNTARSIIAEAILNNLGQGHFIAHSAGSHPKGIVNPLTLKALAQIDFPAEGCRSKGWEEFSAPDAAPLDFVITVCDQAAGEMCPVWPGQPTTAHWGVPDPAAVEGTDEVKLKAFKETAMILKRRIELMLSLPLSKLDRMSLQHKVREIGQQ
jgi:protein-tyrosine-phosphatase